MYKLAILTVFFAIGLVFHGDSAWAAPEKCKEKVSPLKDALTSAYITNSDLQAKLHEQYALDENVSQAVSKFRPQLSATGVSAADKNKQTVKGNSTQLDIPPPNPNTNGYTKQRTRTTKSSTDNKATLTLNQNIYRGGGDLANLYVQESSVTSGQYDLMDTEQQTLLKATQAYMEVMFQTALVKNNKANVNFLNEQLKSVQAQVEVGEKTPTDTAAAESQLAEGNAALVKSQGDLETAKANYLNIIGELPCLLEYPDNLSGIPRTLDEIIAISLKNNPKILQALYNAKAQNLAIDVNTAKLLPSVDLQGNASRDLGDLRQNTNQSGTVRQNAGGTFPFSNRNRSHNHSWTNDAVVQLELTVPIYQGGAEYSAVRQQVEKTAAARYQLEQARKTVEANSVAAWDALNTAREQIVSFKAQLAAAVKARDGAQLEADVGERSYVDVLAFQQKVLQAENSLASARKDEINAQYALYTVLGKLTARELQLPVTLYDVEGHLDDVRYKFAGFGDKPTILDGNDESSTSTQD